LVGVWGVGDRLFLGIGENWGFVTKKKRRLQMTLDWKKEASGHQEEFTALKQPNSSESASLSNSGGEEAGSGVWMNHAPLVVFG